MPHLSDLLLRVVVGTLLGAVIGYERDVHGRPAGLRTHAIVALASATFMVISTQFIFFQHYGKNDLIEVDTSRIAASIVSGIGFLGAGAILRNGASIKGLTTAAGLWLVAAIGMGAGAGMFAFAAFATLLGVTALTLLRRFEDKDDRMAHRMIQVVLSDETPVIDVASRMKGIGVDVSAVEYDRQIDDKKLAVTLDVRFPQDMSIEKLLTELETHPGVRRIKLAQAA